MILLYWVAFIVVVMPIYALVMAQGKRIDSNIDRFYGRGSIITVRAEQTLCLETGVAGVQKKW